jgi:hypothetical protein
LRAISDVPNLVEPRRIHGEDHRSPEQCIELTGMVIAVRSTRPTHEPSSFFLRNRRLAFLSVSNDSPLRPNLGVRGGLRLGIAP